MVKVLAPHPAAWRGKPIEIAEDGSAEVPDEALAELSAHGYRRWTEDDEDRSKNGDHTHPDNMSRKELIELLKGKTEGRVILMSTDDLRAVAKKTLGIEAAAPIPSGDGAKADDAAEGADTQSKSEAETAQDEPAAAVDGTDADTGQTGE